jgi:hypothetical protein
VKRFALVLATAIAVGSACGGGSGSSTESFCAKALAAETSFGQLGDTPSDSSSAIALFEDLTNNAPSEIKGDMTTIFNFLRSPAARNAPADDSVVAASAKVVQFFKDKCHVDLGASGASTSASFSSLGSSISN